ncbi:MAG: hypothetical protein RL885_32120, partial [Planctomycetota bacterium]
KRGDASERPIVRSTVLSRERTVAEQGGIASREMWPKLARENAHRETLLLARSTWALHHNGRRFRLTDVAGKVIHDVIA